MPRVIRDILVFGKGLIGERISEAFKCNIARRKIKSFKDAENEIKKFRPKIIINTTDNNYKNADDCELHKSETLFNNALLPIILAELAIRHKIKLVHIGSGCIFHYDYTKNKPITEKALPNFFDLFYSRTKIYPEITLEFLSRKFNILILRIRIPLDDKPHPKNLLTKLIQYKKVIDVPNSVTYIPDFIKAATHLLKINARGVYNVVNSGSLYYPALMDTYKKYRPKFNYEVIKFKNLHLVRTNIILSTKKIKDSGFKIRNINDVLSECVENYINGK